MIGTSGPATADLPAPVERVLRDFVDAARDAFGPDLRSIVLYGSAAEGRLRRTSDVNVIVVLHAFDPARADRLREPLRVAQTAVRLAAMFLLESEIGAAAEAFAVKFADVLRRRRVLHGDDLFAHLAIGRPAEIARLRQVLHNLHANALNFGWDPRELLDRVPAERIAAIHLAGGRWIGEAGHARRLLDDHRHEVPDPVYDLLREVGRRVPRPLTVILERDGAYPPVGRLLDELDRARAALAEGRRAA